MLFVLSTAFGVFGTNPVSTYLHAVIGGWAADGSGDSDRYGATRY